MSVNVLINNINVESFQIYDSQIVQLYNEKISQFCPQYSLCIINFEILNLAEENYINFKINVKNGVPQFINKNQIIKQTITGDFAKVYYTILYQNDVGRINIVSINQRMNLSYKIVEKESNITRGELFLDNWVPFTDPFSDGISYSVIDKCKNGCYLLLLLFHGKTNIDRMNYLLFISNNNSSIQSIKNEQIISHFSNNQKELRFRFQLYNIAEFRIVIGGSLVQYQFINVDKSIPCCDSFNETYYPEKGNTFIDNIIGDGTIKYNITIEVVAVSNKHNSLLSYYDITVLPFEYSNFPINYINSAQTFNCYTSKNSNSTYFIMPFDKTLEKNNDYSYKISFLNDIPSDIRMYVFFIVLFGIIGII